MLRAFIQLLGNDAPILRRYTSMAVIYGLSCGLTFTVLVPVLSNLLCGNLPQTVRWLIVLVIGLLICWMLRLRVEQAGVRVGIAVVQGARHRIGQHVVELPLGWFTSKNTARLNHLVTQGMMALGQVPAHVMTPLIASIVTPLVLVATLLVLNWRLGLIALGALPLLAGMFYLTRELTRRADEAFHLNFADASQRIVEFAQAQSMLRAFNGSDGSARLLNQTLARQHQASSRLIWLSAASSVLNAWAVQAVFAALLATAGIWLSAQLGAPASKGEIVSAIISLVLVARYIDCLLEVTGYGEALRGAQSQLDAVKDLLATRPLPEPECPALPQDASIDLRGLRFRYTANASDVLRDINLHVPSGSMTALVGASGSGKSTLAHLIARFFDVTDGSVSIGGVDVRQMSGAQRANSISPIFQNSYLFSGSIAENIRVGKPDADDSEVLEAAQLAGVIEITERMPQGMDTPVGEGGARLSGGERQRIAIARALLKDAPILLVDEATAALDPMNQAVIKTALERLRGKRTLIVIAHQLSTVAMADQIVVLERGRIVERGTPAELAKQQGKYAEFLHERETANGWRIESSNAAV